MGGDEDRREVESQGTLGMQPGEHQPEVFEKMPKPGKTFPALRSERPAGPTSTSEPPFLLQERWQLPAAGISPPAASFTLCHHFPLSPSSQRSCRFTILQDLGRPVWVSPHPAVTQKHRPHTCPRQSLLGGPAWVAEGPLPRDCPSPRYS